MKKADMKSVYYLVLVAVFLAACMPSASQVQEVIAQTQAMWTSIPTNTPFPTYTPFPINTPFPTYTAFPTYTLQPTIAVEVTRIVMVTQTYTPTPLYTPTITSTPTNTFTPTNTPNATQTAEALHLANLREDKGDGFYLEPILKLPCQPKCWRRQNERRITSFAISCTNGSECCDAWPTNRVYAPRPIILAETEFLQEWDKDRVLARLACVGV
jgi:hypothetical protein